MWLQYSTCIYKRKGYYAVDGAHISFQKVVLNGANSLSYRGYIEQPLPFLFKTISFVNRASVDVINDSSRSC